MPRPRGSYQCVPLAVQQEKIGLDFLREDKRVGRPRKQDLGQSVRELATRH